MLKDILPIDYVTISSEFILFIRPIKSYNGVQTNDRVAIAVILQSEKLASIRQTIGYKVYGGHLTCLGCTFFLQELSKFFG